MIWPSDHAPSQISAIVPAYNEELTIGEVIRVLASSQLFYEVIVVTDGSTDRTAEVAREAGAHKVLHSPIRKGKGCAMRDGALATESPLILFCDADLLGLQVQHLEQLIQPVISDQVGMCVDLHDRGRFITWLMRYLPLIGGERVLRRDIFLSIPEKYLEGYGVELAMNAYVRSQGLKIGIEKLVGLRIRRKMQKIGFWPGLRGYISMGSELVRAAWHIRLAQLRGKL